MDLSLYMKKNVFIECDVVLELLQQFWDYSSRKAIQKLFNTLFTENVRLFEDNFVLVNDVIKFSIRKSIEKDYLNDVVVSKFLNDKDYTLDGEVALALTNKLRKYCPWFLYVYFVPSQSSSEYIEKRTGILVENNKEVSLKDFLTTDKLNKYKIDFLMGILAQLVSASNLLVENNCSLQVVLNEITLRDVEYKETVEYIQYADEDEPNDMYIINTFGYVPIIHNLKDIKFNDHHYIRDEMNDQAISTIKTFFSWIKEYLPLLYEAKKFEEVEKELYNHDFTNYEGFNYLMKGIIELGIPSLSCQKKKCEPSSSEAYSNTMKDVDNNIDHLHKLVGMWDNVSPKVEFYLVRIMSHIIHKYKNIAGDVGNYVRQILLEYPILNNVYLSSDHISEMMDNIDYMRNIIEILYNRNEDFTLRRAIFDDILNDFKYKNRYKYITNKLEYLLLGDKDVVTPTGQLVLTSSYPMLSSQVEGDNFYIYLTEIGDKTFYTLLSKNSEKEFNTLKELSVELGLNDNVTIDLDGKIVRYNNYTLYAKLPNSITYSALTLEYLYVVENKDDLNIDKMVNDLYVFEIGSQII